MADLTTQIETVAGQEFEVETEEGRARTQDLDKLIRADRYLRSITAGEATSLTNMGYRKVRQRPPGATGPS